MAVISWDNYLDDSTIVNSSDGSEVLTVQNLLTRQLGDIFRQTTSTQLIVDIDLGSAKLTNLICILNHTNLAGESYTLDFGTSSGGSQVGTETGTFFTGATSDATNEMIYLTSGHTARYVRLTVTISSTTVSIGRIWLDNAWSTTAGMEFSVSVADPSPVTRSRGGSIFISERKRARRVACKGFALTENDFRGTVGDSLYKSYLTMDLAVGTSGEIVFLPLTDSQINRNRLGVYGHVSNSQPMKVMDRTTSDGLSIEKRFTVEEDF